MVAPGWSSRGGGEGTQWMQREGEGKSKLEGREELGSGCVHLSTFTYS